MRSSAGRAGEPRTGHPVRPRPGPVSGRRVRRERRWDRDTPSRRDPFLGRGRDWFADTYGEELLRMGGHDAPSSISTDPPRQRSRGAAISPRGSGGRRGRAAHGCEPARTRATVECGSSCRDTAVAEPSGSPGRGSRRRDRSGRQRSTTRSTEAGVPEVTAADSMQTSSTPAFSTTAACSSAVSSLPRSPLRCWRRSAELRGVGGARPGTPRRGDGRGTCRSSPTRATPSADGAGVLARRRRRAVRRVAAHVVPDDRSVEGRDIERRAHRATSARPALSAKKSTLRRARRSHDRVAPGRRVPRNRDADRERRGSRSRRADATRPASSLHHGVRRDRAHRNRERPVRLVGQSATGRPNRHRRTSCVPSSSPATRCCSTR